MASPQTLQVAPARWHGAVVVGDGLEAIAMRAGLAAEVNFHLSFNGFHGPVLRCPARRFTQWIFLTTGHGGIRRDTLADVLTSQVRLVRAGTRLVLPDADSEVSWVVAPDRDTALFPWHAVLAAVRATSGSHW